MYLVYTYIYCGMGRLFTVVNVTIVWGEIMNGYTDGTLCSCGAHSLCVLCTLELYIRVLNKYKMRVTSIIRKVPIYI